MLNPENKLNDATSLCYWQGLWHLFYQVKPPEEDRPHWGHAVSKGLTLWGDLPYAPYPEPENACCSGTVLVEKDLAVAMYHSTEIGNMIAISHDPLLLYWTKLTGQPVIPFGNSNEQAKPYGVFDPCIWEKDGTYYVLSAGIENMQFPGRHAAASYLFRSLDLIKWEFLHEFVEGDRFTVIGDDRACPYLLPIGDRHYTIFH